jgi:hypothetical protein
LKLKIEFSPIPLRGLKGVNSDLKRQLCPCKFTLAFCKFYDFTLVLTLMKGRPGAVGEC